MVRGTALRVWEHSHVRALKALGLQAEPQEHTLIASIQGQLDLQQKLLTAQDMLVLHYCEEERMGVFEARTGSVGQSVVVVIYAGYCLGIAL